jgi:transcriptional regulator with XRE-family HTH domain
LGDFPTALIEVRIVAGLTQKQLGERLKVEGQEIERREANLSSGVGAERLQVVADALGMAVKVIVSYSGAARL